MYNQSIIKFQKQAGEKFNRKNTISIEWPDYMSSNPNMIVMDNERRYYSKGKIKSLLKNQSTSYCQLDVTNL